MAYVVTKNVAVSSVERFLTWEKFDDVLQMCQVIQSYLPLVTPRQYLFPFAPPITLTKLVVYNLETIPQHFFRGEKPAIQIGVTVAEFPRELHSNFIWRNQLFVFDLLHTGHNQNSSPDDPELKITHILQIIEQRRQDAYFFWGVIVEHTPLWQFHPLFEPQMIEIVLDCF